MSSYSIGYNWFNGALTLQDCTNDSGSTHMIWTTLYNQIFVANNVIGTIDPETEEPLSQYYLAQALAIRAFDYFTLVQLYQFTYKGNENKDGVPIITPENKEEAAANGLARSSVQEVYDFVMNDITKAIELLKSSGKARSDKRYVSLDVAYGIRARINLVMENWSAALSDAEAALSTTPYTPLSLEEAAKPGFIDIEDHSWMWGVLITDKDRVSTTGICNFPSHMGSLNYGYASVGAWRMINKKLFNSIPLTDVRRGWFLDENRESVNLTPVQQDYISETSAAAYTQVKYGVKADEVGTSENDNDVPLMRVEEMYLIKAEAQAMSGDVAGGLQTLQDFVQVYRNPAYLCNAASAQELQDAVWYQRRLEFWGEGLSWYDIKRLNKGIHRLGGGFPAVGVFEFDGTDNIMNYPIPFNEEQYNKLLEPNPTVKAPDPIPDAE